MTGKELEARRREHLDVLARSLLGCDELENGFSYRFPFREKILRDLAEIIHLERRCCPFLTFKLILEAGSDAVALELTGAEGTKKMIASLFGWN